MSSQLLAPPTGIKALTLCSLFRSRVGPDAPGKFAQAACSYCPRQQDFPTTDGGHYVGDAIKNRCQDLHAAGTVKPDDFDPKTIVHAARQDGNCGEGLLTLLRLESPGSESPPPSQMRLLCHPRVSPTSHEISVNERRRCVIRDTLRTILTQRKFRPGLADQVEGKLQHAS